MLIHSAYTDKHESDIVPAEMLRNHRRASHTKVKSAIECIRSTNIYQRNLYILTKDYISKERKINKNLYFLCVSLSEECRRSDVGDRVYNKRNCGDTGVSAATRSQRHRD